VVEVHLPARRHLKDKEARHLLKEFTERFPSSESTMRSAKTVEELAVAENLIFFLDEKPLILRTQVGVLPSLKFEELINNLPKVVVDMGAVAHVVNGAQIMRPGIKEVKGPFAKGDLVVIVDEKFNKAIALGLAEMDSESMKLLNKGKAISNLHYVGDELWKAFTAQATH
jgi:PUA-domain protein